MSDTPLKVHGVPEPKGKSWLKEVKLDAARNTIEQLRRQAEAQKYEAAKARGITPQEIIEQGKIDLSEDNVEEAPVETEKGKK